MSINDGLSDISSHTVPAVLSDPVITNEGAIFSTVSVLGDGSGGAWVEVFDAASGARVAVDLDRAGVHSLVDTLTLAMGGC